MKRTKELQKFTDNFAKKAFGKSQTEAKEQNICVFCHNVVKMEDFRDELSRKEYNISGLCMKCQDDIFGMITKNYIKMCEKAEEIQKEWGCRKGDWVKYKDDVIVLKQGYLDVEILEREYLIFCNDITEINGLVFGDKKYQFIWLPTQEQLQEMILPIFLKRFSTTHALRNDSSFIYRMIIEKFQRWINRSSPSLDEYMAMFSSMNELWLAFVMKEKYKKEWDGKKWK